ncbi:SgcJ/EcaC family oxidoreductase [Micromonospora sp. HUAS LYJ1]|uniref:SgcJ/EcaC family oxidoreductase n=1 Tax=Micromonospora TaxID=1873 RepID=UPI002671317C|nr:SgcJ/EcaC family oxidoreductase [Micromonospora sp. HUAS LYJ1]WKU06702.1 SgcJ/EcaC family oxidoreductase [Micromonospora sp. HUAS LYJ1]
MSTEGASLVAGAKQWASYYGDFPNGVEGAVLTAPLRCRAAWDANDAEGFASLFIDNGSMLVGDNQLMSRDEIRTYLGELFAGPYKGSRLTLEFSEIQVVSESMALAVSVGGVVYADADGLAPADNLRIMWVVVKRDGDWRIASYQSSPITG